MKMLQEKRRLILIALVVLVLVCLLGVVAYNQFFGGGGDGIAEQPAPIATEVPTEEATEVVATVEQPTATPTPVVEDPTETPEPEATEEPTAEPTAEPIATEAIASTATEFVPVAPVEFVLQIEEILQNGSFEAGFDETTGIGMNWQGFRSGDATMTFSQEVPGPFVHDGSSAQRISVQNSTAKDRYAGIYQTIEVVPEESYTITVRGQIRSGVGDVNESGYGYRIQYAVDHEGKEDWQAITTSAWIELPWEEQKLDTSQVTFSEFSDQVTAESDQMTIFVRVWNKWADPGLSEYTLDSLSLVGPKPGSEVAVVSAASGSTATGSTTAGSADTSQQMVDQALPVTGINDSVNILTDGRFWGALVVLLMLGVGATYPGQVALVD